MRTRYNLRLLSGLVALSTILPTTAYADDVYAEGSDNSVTITGTTRTQIQSPGQPDTGTPYTGGDDGGASAASADGADGGATRPCYLGILDLKAMYTFSCLFAPAAPDPGGGVGGESPTTVTITATDVAALLIDGSGLHRQPPGPQALITLDVIAYTSPDTRTITTTVANTPVTDCRHQDEPGCAVRQAVGEGSLDAACVECYLRMSAESSRLRQHTVGRAHV